MTTTLRPAGPEEHAGGARVRPYDIRVNGRTAGSLWLGCEEFGGVLTGVVQDLVVHPEDRRRGRATVAALAAEEVLRGWGCRRVSVALPEGQEGAARLAASLGYLPKSAHLLKELTAPPQLPPGSLLRPLADDEYALWKQQDAAEHTALLAAQGLPLEQAAESTERAHRELLPDGPATTGMVLRVLEEHGGERAGTVWVQVDGSPRHDADAWVYLVRVEEGRRGKGHGRTLMLAAEREALAGGATVLGLNVHSDNTVAQNLYRSLGYRRVETQLGKQLL
jgi:ribosomal protein S18 acetylase RimI-like enzyme